MRRVALGLGRLAAAAAFAATAAGAATITVTSTADNGAGCTLRNAVMSSNDGTSHGGCTPGGASNTISLGGGTYFVNSPPINIYQHSVVFQGAGAGSTLIDAQLQDHVFDNFDPGTPVALTIAWQDLTIRNGKALSSGPTGYGNAGAIFIDTATTALVTRCVIQSNQAESSGGAIENWGSLSVTDSTFTANTAPGEGGAIRNTGTLSITGSTFSGNSSGAGGAVWHSSAATPATISNSTFANNSATVTGGAISADDPTSGGLVTLTHVTVAANTAPTGGGIYTANAAGFRLDRSIVATNSAGTGADCANGGTGFTSLDYNMFGSLTGCTVGGTTTHNVVTATPRLAALANNGGSTQTVALQDLSPAIDIAPTCATPFDQRGVARPIGAACDAGAFEAPLPLVLSPAAGPLTSAAVGVAYSGVTFTTANGVGPFTYAIASGSLPVGMSLSSAGVLSGTPSAAGTFSFAVISTDTFNSRTGTASYSLVSNAPTVLLAPASVPDGTAGISYSQSFGASGGTPPYTFGVTTGALPPGLTLSSAGLLSGTPTTGGTFSFTVTAADSSTGAGAPFTASIGYSVTITVPPPITIAPATLAAATVASGYGVTLVASGGTAPYTFALTAGALPAGLSLSSAGVLSGTPSAGGTFNFTVTATDSTPRSGSQAYSLTVNAPTIALSPITLPGGTYNAAYSQTLSASGGTAPYSIAVFTGALPAGITLSSAGVLSGTPTATGPFSFTATATDSSTGTGPYTGSRAYSFTIAATVPGAPVIGPATAGDAQATVTFTPPASNGGSAITGYTVTSSPGGITATGAASPITVNGLTNGTAYTFTVTATNSAGIGPASAASNSVTPKAAQTITFANPGPQNFGTAPTLTATSSSGLTVTFSSATTGVCTITSGGVLTFVTAGPCTINADQAGNNAFVAATTVPQSFTVNAVMPGAPTIGAATAGDTKATVTFTAPLSTGGAAITGYTVTSSPGGITATGAASPITVNGLTNGTAYTFTVTATNSAGPGPASGASNSVTPKAAQTITFANPGARNFGTSPTLTATASSGLSVTFTSATPAVCTATPVGVLTFATTGTCTINADQAGNNAFLAATTVPQSFAVNAVVPGAPTIGTATPGLNQAAIAFTAPASTGGAPITSYVATCSPGGITATGTSSPITVTGLTIGTTYTCSVAARNSAGTGPASATVSATASAAVTSFTGPSPTGPGTITAAFTGGGVACTYTTARFIPVSGDPASPPTVASNIDFPQGLFDFATSGCTIGGAITMTITYPAALPAGAQYWKYGPTATNTAPHWYVLPAAISGNTATFTITDGGLGDDDLAANGGIVDQGGPGIGNTNANQVPTLSEWAMLLLVTLVGFAGMRRRKRG
jgi:predicted outer membrane repeat protein